MSLICEQIRVKSSIQVWCGERKIIYNSFDWDLSNEIEKIERRATRFATSDYQNYELGSVTKLLEDLGWKSQRTGEK